MPVSMKTDPQAGLLIFRISGMTSPEQMLDAVTEVRRQHLENGLCRVLVDAVNRMESLGMLELLDVGKALAEPALHGVRLAVFSSKPQAGIEFTRTVVAHKNGALMRAFCDEQAARAWLFSPLDPLADSEAKPEPGSEIETA